MTQPTMLSIGEKLKAARGKKSLTIEQVQKETLIHSSVLIALEEGRCDKMLTGTYVKSFLKKYAAHLGLDAREIAAEYQAAQPAAARPAEPAPQKHAAPPVKLPRIDLSAVAKKAAPLLVAALALVLIVVIGSSVTKFIAGRAHTSRSPAAASGGAKKTPVQEASRGQAASSGAEQSGRAAAAVPKPAPLTVVLRTKRAVYVSARVDGIVIVDRKLPGGTVETLTAETSINLYIGRGDAVEITLNGRRVTNIGRGLIKDLEITRKGVRLKS